MSQPDKRELEALQKIFLKAETDIINEIARLRSRGLIDYHAVASLERVQEILKNMQNEAFDYVPKMVEKQFYVRVPEARKILETVEKHIEGYENAQALTSTQTDVVQRLSMNTLGIINEAAATSVANLRNVLIGPRADNIYRSIGLDLVTQAEATGRSVTKYLDEFVSRIMQEGITAHTDKLNRNWSLHTYCNMVVRTTSRQAEVLAVLTADETHDLYKISSHGTTCKICAPLEGRVYSRSGKDPDFPPLAKAFGKVDPNGADDLSNTWLNIHPNCLHVLMPWSPMGRTDEEIDKIKKFSSFKTNPRSVDPRSKKQINAYNSKQRERAKWLSDYRQWEKYRVALPGRIPSNFATFQKHKIAKDATYERYMKEYRERDKPKEVT